MKKGISKVIIFIIFLLIIAFCAIGYCYLKTDLFKTPDVLYKKYMAKNLNQIMSANYEPLGSALKRMSNEPFEDDLKIKVDLEKLNGEENLDEDEIEKLKEGYIFNFKLKSDPKNLKSELDATIKYDGYESSINTLFTQDEFGLQIDELNEKYFIIQNNNLKQLFKNFGLSEEKIEDIPDKIITDIKYSEEADKINALEEKYINRVLEQISEDKYKVEKKVSVTYNDQNYIGNKYTLSLTDKEAYTILITTIKELIDDQDFLSLIPEDEKDDFEKQLSELKEKIANYEEDIEKFDNEVMELSVYNISDSFTIIEFKYKEGLIKLYSQINGNNSNIEAIVSSSKNDDMILKVNNTYADNSGELIYSLTVESEESKLVLKSTNNEDSITTNISLDGKAFEDIKNVLSITNTIKFNNIKFKSIDDDNSIILNDLSKTEIEDLITDVQKNITKSISGDSNSLIGLLFMGYFRTSLNNSYSNSYDDYYSYNNNTPIISENDSNNSIEDNTNIVLDEPENNIDEERQKVEDEVDKVISDLLDEYHRDKLTNEEADPAEYLTEEKIVAGCTYAKASIVDGNTIKSVKGENVYYTKIYINGDDWTLNNVETTYSESGEME